jgi:diketogulonate reductase-like aldo/keto reductase
MRRGPEIQLDNDARTAQLGLGVFYLAPECTTAAVMGALQTGVEAADRK